MGGQKECTEEDRASHWLLQAEGRKQDSRARAALLERERQRVRADGGEKCPMLASPHLPMGPEAKAWLKAVRMTSVCQCQGKGYTVTGQK